MSYDNTPHVEVIVTRKGDGATFGEHTARAGQVIHLPEHWAAARARSGEVEYTTKIRAKVDNLSGGSAGDLVMMRGDIACCSPDRAAKLAADGVAELTTAAPTIPRAKVDPMAALTG